MQILPGRHFFPMRPADCLLALIEIVRGAAHHQVVAHPHDLDRRSDAGRNLRNAQRAAASPEVERKLAPVGELGGHRVAGRPERR